MKISLNSNIIFEVNDNIRYEHYVKQQREREKMEEE